MARPNPEKLLAAAREGRVDAIRSLLAGGTGVDVCDRDGQTPLNEAAWNGHAEAVQVLLEAGADPKRKNSRALDFAVRSGTAECVKVLLAAGADPNAGVRKGNAGDPTMLMDAIARGDKQIIELLLAAGADVKAVAGATGVVAHAIATKRNAWVDKLIDAGGALDGSLVAAVNAKRLDLLKRLLTLGVPADDLRPGHGTPLSAAVMDGHVEFVKCLIAAGADVNRKSPDGLSPLQSAVLWGHASIIGLLLKAKAAVPDDLLIEAIGSEEPACVKVLLEHGCDASRAPDGLPPLFHAIGGKSAKMVDLLIAAGADVNARVAPKAGKKKLPARSPLSGKRVPEGMTPLMLAAHNGSEKIVAALLAAGADPQAVDQKQQTASDYASNRGQTAIVKALAARGAASKVAPSKMHSQAMLRAIVKGDEAGAKKSLAAGADPDTADKYGTAALSHAAQKGMADLVRKLLAAGAKPDHVGKPDGIPALRQAAIRENAEIVRLLIGAGANCKPRWQPGSIPADERNTVYLSYSTPLHDAAAYGRAENVDLLLAAGADINAADEHNVTPLLAAVNHRQMQVVAQLLAAGAKVRPDDEPWLAPYRFAEAAKSKAIRQLRDAVSKVVGSQPIEVETLPGVACWTVRLADRPELPPITIDTPEAGRAWGKQFADQYAGLYELSNQTIDKLERQMTAAGCLLVDAGMPLGCGPMVRHLALLPTRDKFAAMIAFGVRGNDQELSTADIVGWFRELDREHPFDLRGIRFDAVNIEFRQPVPDPKGMAARMCKFCHDLGDKKEVAVRLKETRRVDFWWD